jgi:hypothetical protein
MTARPDSMGSTGPLLAPQNGRSSKFNSGLSNISGSQTIREDQPEDYHKGLQKELSEGHSDNHHENHLGSHHEDHEHVQPQTKRGKFKAHLRKFWWLHLISFLLGFMIVTLCLYVM